MKSNHLNSKTKAELSWSSSIEQLFRNQKLNKTATALKGAGFVLISDLLWLLPLKKLTLPSLESFEHIEPDAYFRGAGIITTINSRPCFRGKGRGRAYLINISITLNDVYSDRKIELKWFNSYQSILTKLKSLTKITFLGKAQQYLGNIQIVNPEFQSFDGPEEDFNISETRIIYPTVNKCSGNHIKKIFDRIPVSLWDNIPETLPLQILEKNHLLGLQQSFNIIHGKDITLFDCQNREQKEEMAFLRLVYEEFFKEQIKIQLRKDATKKQNTFKALISNQQLNKFCEIFPYKLTADQLNALADIREDLKKGHPMMRMLQGDVGCGKTSIAIISALIVLAQGKQVALMCPTESLAIQHFRSITDYLKSYTTIKIALLIGAYKKSQKNEIQHKLKTNQVDFIIGTHSLFQDNTEFNDLGLIIIDEQHKFGVDQRIRLMQKGAAVHSLLMSATPIPRSLSLTRYGDLDISLIKTLPSTRSGQKTKLITPKNFDKFLNFLHTRLKMNEQAYIVVPVINENPTQEILDLKSVHDRFSTFFPNFKVTALHGQLKTEEKSDIFLKFSKHEIDLLIATSVIEVGINVMNATVMAIMNPERFGLSSLHQLRGRVGRGRKQGFCFLICDQALSQNSRNRLAIIESTHDGFKIAEEDLRLRGEGDLFGKNQSGEAEARKIGSYNDHIDLLLMAQKDAEAILTEDSSQLVHILNETSRDIKIFATI